MENKNPSKFKINIKTYHGSFENYNLHICLLLKWKSSDLLRNFCEILSIFSNYIAAKITLKKYLMKPYFPTQLQKIWSEFFLKVAASSIQAYQTSARHYHDVLDNFLLLQKSWQIRWATKNHLIHKPKFTRYFKLRRTSK